MIITNYEDKPSVFIVQGFGYSGSTAVTDFLSTIAGEKNVAIVESLLLKAFFSLAYAAYIGCELSLKRKQRLLDIFLIKNDRSKSKKEWQRAAALLEKVNIPLNIYLEKATKTLQSFDNSMAPNNSAAVRKKIVNDAATEYFCFITTEIHKNLGVVVYDNLINAHLTYWLQVLDLSKFQNVYVYTIYRNNLRDQFYEQIKNSQWHSTSTLGNFKSLFLYLYIKFRALINRNDQTRSGGVDLLPIGSYQFLNKYSAKIYWTLFIRDLKKRFLMYDHSLSNLLSNGSIIYKIMSFEAFVADDDILRQGIQADFALTSDFPHSKNLMADFEYLKSQNNIECHKRWKYNYFISNSFPETANKLLAELEIRFHDN